MSIDIGSLFDGVVGGCGRLSVAVSSIFSERLEAGALVETEGSVEDRKTEVVLNSPLGTWNNCIKDTQ